MDFFIAIILLLLGHVLRLFRTFIVLNNYIDKPIQPFFRSLGIGYIVDFFSPFRISDIVRTYIFSRMSHTPWSLSIGLTIFERLLDTGILLLVLIFLKIPFISMLCFFLIIVSFIILCHLSFLKVSFLWGSSIFNDRIKKLFLSTYWVVFRLRKQFIESPKLTVQFVTLSLAMFCANMGSLYFLSNILGQSTFIDTVQNQFVGLRSSGIWSISQIFNELTMHIYILYMIIPTIIIIMFSYVPINIKMHQNFKMIPFLSKEDALLFLEKFMKVGFSESDELYYQLTHSMNIIKDLSAASEAKTFLVEKDDVLFIRKIAYNQAVPSLQKQLEWLNNYTVLPTPKLLQSYNNENLCYYDMEYFAGGENFFTMIHQMPTTDSFGILQSISQQLTSAYKEIDCDNQQYTKQYFNDKVIKNRDIILTKLHSLAEFPILLVNDTTVPNILYTKTVEQMEKYSNTLCYPIYHIHGDLTVENILVNTNKDYIIIDPAPSYINIFAEYAKLFQSLHAKYEHVKKADTSIVDGNRIDYAQYATTQYEELFNKLQEYIINNYGLEGLKATYFYEAICHIRTASYMIKLDKNQKAILMLALAGNALKKWQEME